MNAKDKFNAVYKTAKVVMEQHTLYSSSYTFVENKLNNPAVSKKFQELEVELKKQLDKLRKEASK